MWKTKVVVLHLNIGNKLKLFICLLNASFLTSEGEISFPFLILCEEHKSTALLLEQQLLKKQRLLRSTLYYPYKATCKSKFLEWY